MLKHLKQPTHGDQTSDHLPKSVGAQNTTCNSRSQHRAKKRSDLRRGSQPSLQPGALLSHLAIGQCHAIGIHWCHWSVESGSWRSVAGVSQPSGSQSQRECWASCSHVHIRLLSSRVKCDPVLPTRDFAQTHCV